MVRCLKYDEDECLGHDCIGRLGTPCLYDAVGLAGTEDLEPEEVSCHICDGINGSHIHGCPAQ